MTSLVGGQAEDYLRHLVVERGLSDNTVQALSLIHISEPTRPY